MELYAYNILMYCEKYYLELRRTDEGIEVVNIETMEKEILNKYTKMVDVENLFKSDSIEEKKSLLELFKIIKEVMFNGTDRLEIKSNHAYTVVENFYTLYCKLEDEINKAEGLKLTIGKDLKKFRLQSNIKNIYKKIYDIENRLDQLEGRQYSNNISVETVNIKDELRDIINRLMNITNSIE